MTMYWGGSFAIIFFSAAYIATEVFWLATLVGLVGLVIGHWLDPLTHIGPNSLRSNRGVED